ncbi:acyltransferase family protein [Catelliglobosispora koreensis]|uniref:acyltransferase family protein n=1 Tax=Catelliglobosispora koreensis TaxID=129052 RepID=UPI0012FA0609|nr:acyltransferase [Catelliglobosispora koreensis]
MSEAWAVATQASWAGDSAGRLPYVDNLKCLLVAAIIAGHGVLSYAEFDWWSYADVREVTLSRVTVAVLFALAAPFGLFAVPLLFLVAGLLTPPSLRRKGVRRYVRDRLVRLGVPFVIFAVVLWPLLEYGLFRWYGQAPGLREYLAAEGSLDTGVLWFVGVLLIFSLAYAAWVRLSPQPVRSASRDLPLTHLFGLAAAVAAGSFLVRLVVPLESDNKVIDLNMSQWPACAALFGLGVAGYHRGWLSRVTENVRRKSRTATLMAITAFGAFAVAGAIWGGVTEQTWSGGWRWPALAFAAIESMLAIFGAIWFLAAAQRLLDRDFRWIRPAARRSAYGAFLLQGIVLLGLALVLRPVPLVAEAKAVIVAMGGVAGSFWLAWLLIRRFPIVARLL